MAPPALFKAGEYVLSRDGSQLKVLRSMPIIELEGILAGQHVGYKYLLLNGKGNSLTLKERVLSKIEDTTKNEESRKSTGKSTSSLFNEEDDHDLAEALDSVSVTRDFEEDLMEDFAPLTDDEWDDEKIFSNIDEYFWHRNTKPLPTKRRCFQLSPPPPKIVKLSEKSKFPPTHKMNSLSSVSQERSRKASSEKKLSTFGVFSSSLHVALNTTSQKGEGVMVKTPVQQQHKKVNKKLEKNETPGAVKPTGQRKISVGGFCPSPVVSSSSQPPSNALGATKEIDEDVVKSLQASAISPVPTPVQMISSSPISPDAQTPVGFSSKSPSLKLRDISSESPPSTSVDVSSASTGSTTNDSLFPPSSADDTCFKTPGDPIEGKEARKGRKGKKTFLSREERNKLLKPKWEPKDSARKTNAIVELFSKYLEEYGENRDFSSIPSAELSEMLASFWTERKKKDGGIHDIPTLHSDCSRLAAHLHRETGRNPTTHPSFESYRTTKGQKLVQSKQTDGNGQLRNQADALDPEEIAHFFETGLINTGSGIGITRMLFVTFMIVLNSRAIKDLQVLKLGNLKIVRNAEGLIEYAYFVSQFGKTDDGKKAGITRRGIIPPSSTRSTCFFTYWEEFMAEREKLGPDFLEPDSPLFLQPRNDGVDYVKTKNDCKFRPEPMKLCLLNDMLKNMCVASKIEAGERKLTNTSLRISSFHRQENVGIDSQAGQSVSGHSSKETCATYRRKNQDRMHNVGAGLMSQMTGVPAVVPLTHGQKFALKIHKQITTVDTSSSIQDFTPQLLSLKRAQKETTFNPDDKLTNNPSFVPHYLQLKEVSTNHEGVERLDKTEIRALLTRNQAQLHSLLADHQAEVQDVLDQHPKELQEVLVQQHVQQQSLLAHHHAQLHSLLRQHKDEATATFIPNGTNEAVESVSHSTDFLSQSDPIVLPIVSDGENLDLPADSPRDVWLNVLPGNSPSGDHRAESQLKDIASSDPANATSELVTSTLEPKESVSSKEPKLTSAFKLHDLVFAKVRGHRDPPWPAKVTSVTSTEYTVKFFGTNQVAKFSRESAEDGLLVGYSDASSGQFSNPKNLRPDKKKLFGISLVKIAEESGYLCFDLKDAKQVNSQPSKPLPKEHKRVLQDITNRENNRKSSLSLSKKQKLKRSKENDHNDDLDDFQL